MRRTHRAGVVLARSFGARRMPPRQDLGLRRQRHLGQRGLQRRVRHGGQRAGAAGPAVDGRTDGRHASPPIASRPGASSTRVRLPGGPRAALASCRSVRMGWCATSTRCPARQTFTDHLGNERTVDGRNDIQPHRIILFLKGWLGHAEADLHALLLDREHHGPGRDLRASSATSSTASSALYAGINGTPGTRSLQGSHPYWLGHDRLMADEFFRPVLRYRRVGPGRNRDQGLWYNAMLANNSSSLGVKAAQLDRELGRPAPRSGGCRPPRSSARTGAFGDWEYHEKLATRVGSSTTFRARGALHRPTTGATGNTGAQLADSRERLRHRIARPGHHRPNGRLPAVAIDARRQVQGHLRSQTEFYLRWLHDFQVADGPLPVARHHRPRLLGAGRVLPGEEEAGSATARRRRSRRQGRRIRQ